MKNLNFSRTIITAIVSAMLIGCCVPVMAEEVVEEETTAETKDLDDMTIEELKIAYLELQLENEKLKNELNSLQQETPETEAEVETEEAEVETEVEPVLMDVEEFEEDIVASYNDRAVVGQKHTTAEVSSMTNQEYVDYYYEAVSAESDFYDKYKNAEFEDLNIQYLCGQYIEGLGKQFDACQSYFDSGDFDEFSQYWSSGYYNRAYAVVELSDYYDLPFGDVSDMREDTEAMDSLNEAETRNAAVDSATVQKVQQLLNDIGFYCGNADGVSGKRTVKSIKRFQEMYGYEPIDGMIDDELVEQLETEAAKKGLVTEAEEETAESSAEE